jgi:anhydro-N-acetylmuramic acid kinase
MNTKLPINIIGIMSGTSLDGVDLALCQFDEKNGEVSYNILHTKSVSYSDYWLKTLQKLTEASAREYVATDNAYGKYLGELVRFFSDEVGIQADFIGSHGHTIFHEPDKGYTAQIGNPNAIYAQCEIPVIADFRSLDVQYGGTGAPLVPVGDQELFKNYICVNLGGIANLSFSRNKETIAYDISPFNLLFNHIAKQRGLRYDDSGTIASEGIIYQPLLDKLNDCPYYKKKYPKSLDKSWVEDYFFTLIDDFEISEEDKQRTIAEHLTVQINNSLKEAYKVTKQPILFTGGGTHNTFFIDLLKKKAGFEIIIPSRETIDFKEALIFAFLAYRKLHHKDTVLAQVTGATRNTCGGVLATE